jgi:hypothetical protein
MIHPLCLVLDHLLRNLLKIYVRHKFVLTVRTLSEYIINSFVFPHFFWCVGNSSDYRVGILMMLRDLVGWLVWTDYHLIWYWPEKLFFMHEILKYQISVKRCSSRHGSWVVKYDCFLLTSYKKVSFWSENGIFIQLIIYEFYFNPIDLTLIW